MKTYTHKTAVAALRGKGLNQTEIGKIARVSQMTVSRWSRKEPRLTPPGTLERMVKHLEKLKAKK